MLESPQRSEKFSLSHLLAFMMASYAWLMLALCYVLMPVLFFSGIAWLVKQIF